MNLCSISLSLLSLSPRKDWLNDVVSARSFAVLGLDELLGPAFLVESEVDPESEAGKDNKRPRDPDIGWRRSIKVEIAGTISVLIRKKYFREDDGH